MKTKKVFIAEYEHTTKLCSAERILKTSFRTTLNSNEFPTVQCYEVDLENFIIIPFHLKLNGNGEWVRTDDEVVFC